MKPFEEVAVAFASALVEGDFVRAHGLLAPNLKQELSPEALREQLFDMFRDYSEGPPKAAHFDDQFSHEDWPAKQPGDRGWAYVGIHGDDFMEAVSVTVTDVEGALLIREVEWGRP